MMHNDQAFAEWNSRRSRRSGARFPSRVAMVKALRSKLENIDQHIKEVRARRRQIVKLLKEMGDWAPSWAAAGGAASPRRYSAWCVAEVTGRPWSFSGSPNSCSDHSQSWRLSRRI